MDMETDNFAVVSVDDEGKTQVSSMWEILKQDSAIMIEDGQQICSLWNLLLYSNWMNLHQICFSINRIPH